MKLGWVFLDTSDNRSSIPGTVLNVNPSQSLTAAFNCAKGTKLCLCVSPDETSSLVAKSFDTTRFWEDVAKYDNNVAPIFPTCRTVLCNDENERRIEEHLKKVCGIDIRQEVTRASFLFQKYAKTKTESEKNIMKSTTKSIQTDTDEDAGGVEDRGTFSAIFEEGKRNAIDGIWMTAADETVQLFREPTVAYINNHFGPMPAGIVNTVINTEIGEGAFAIALGSAMGLIGAVLPRNVANDPRYERLGKEIRVFGFYKTSRFVVELVAAPVRNRLTQIVLDLPEVSKNPDA